VIRAPAIAVLVLVLAGCITETTGGLPPPLPADERVDAQLDLARGYLEKRDTARARAPLQRALEINPKSVEALVFFGVLYETEGEPALAEDYYKKALRVAPSDPQALNNYGVFIYRQGRFEEALKPLRKLVANPDYRLRAQAFENLGLAEVANGELDAAKQSFDRALQLDMSQVRSTLELADIYYQVGDLLVAGQYYDSYIARAQQTSRSLCVGVRIASARGLDDQEASYAMALRNLYPEAARRCGVPAR
jgi:type IV pilus assembly protein PilF